MKNFDKMKLATIDEVAKMLEQKWFGKSDEVKNWLDEDDGATIDCLDKEKVSKIFTELEEGDTSVGGVHNFLDELNKKAIVTVVQGDIRFKIDSFYVVDGVFLLNVIPEEIENECEIPTVDRLLQLIIDESIDKTWNDFNYWDDVEVKIIIGENLEDDSEALLIKSMHYDEIHNEAIISVG